MKSYLIPACLALLLCLAGCADQPSPTPTPPPSSTAWVPTSTELALIQSGAQVATGAALTFAVSDVSERTTLANEIYSAANALDTLATGTVPTAAQLQATVLAFGGSQPTAQYVSYAANLSALYAAYYAKLEGNPKAAVQVIEALAAGTEAGASVYATVTTGSEG